jgi:hypothetical protein
MKKSVRTFLFIISLIIIITIGFPITKNLIKNNKIYEGELSEASPQPQNLSIFVLPATPIISIISPENKTYSTNTILLNYSITNDIDFIWYNLDNGINITINSPKSFDAAEGTNTLYLYANNSQGVSFKSIIFSVEIESIQPPANGGGSGGGGGSKTEPLENITTPQENSKNIINTTEKETPKNITETENPKETPKSSGLITIIFLISLLFLILLILLIIILITRIKKKLRKEIKRKNTRKKIK